MTTFSAAALCGTVALLVFGQGAAHAQEASDPPTTSASERVVPPERDPPPRSMAVGDAGCCNGAPGASLIAVMAGPDGQTVPVPLAPVRVGLPQALERRAGFTRAHRGPFAAAREGDAEDSSAVAAAYHAGERVYFAWHQEGTPTAIHGGWGPRNDAVVFAGFDKAGSMTNAPIVLGSGRWPNVVADGPRVAVAWSRGDGSAARFYDGKTWSDEKELAGSQPALAFGPADGPLYAATSAGLWKLAGQSFQRVEEGPYYHPALAVDTHGQPHVVWQQDQTLMYEGEALGTGERPTLLVSADGAAHLAFLSDGAVVIRSRQNGAWSEPRLAVPADRQPAWPMLALGEGEGDAQTQGLRLTWLGPAEHGPDALWLSRPGSPTAMHGEGDRSPSSAHGRPEDARLNRPQAKDSLPLLLPSLAGNIEDAWLLMRFQIMGGSRWGYRPHDVRVSVNGDWIHWFRNAIPEGRYLFPIDPARLAASTGRPAFNRVQVDTWHMNGGHYMTSTDFAIITRTAWGESFAYAADEQEALLAASRPNLNHDRPDLAILANSMEVPGEPPASGRIDFAVTVANLGEGESAPAALAVHGGEGDSTPLAMLKLPAIKPGERWTGDVQLEGKLERVRFDLIQGEPDFDPDNDSLTLTLWTAEEAAEEKPLLKAVPAAEALVTVEQSGEPVPFVILDKAGKEVARSDAGHRAVALKPGAYVIQSGDFQVPIDVKPPRGGENRGRADLAALTQEYTWLSNIVINTNNANLTLRETDGSFRRWYNSRSLYDGPLGFGWTFDYGDRLGRTPEGLHTVQEIDGFQSTYQNDPAGPAPDEWSAVDAPFASHLKHEDDQILRFIDAAQYERAYGRRVSRQVFALDGRLLAVWFADGSRHELRYEGELVNAVVDHASGNTLLAFTAGPGGRIATVTDPEGRQFSYIYTRNTLTGVKDAGGHGPTYTYSRGLNLETVAHGDGSRASFGYDEDRDWITSLRAGSLEYSFIYEEASPTRFWTLRTDADGNLARWDFDEQVRQSIVTTVEYVDGRIEPLDRHAAEAAP